MIGIKKKNGSIHESFNVYKYHDIVESHTAITLYF